VEIMLTSVMKQYMKYIYLLADPTDQAIPLQVAYALGVYPSTVSKMTRKLANHGLIKYEHYGKLHLTKEGKQLGQTLVKHHEILEQFLRIMGIKDTYLRKELEEIEFNVGPYLIERIELLNQYFSQDKTRIHSFYQFCNQ
jgi:Mn-dependent DtxR family transcriptional regulator